MIPILFEHSETTFTGNGLGRLIDCIECLVTEELNGIYELSLVYPVSGRHYSQMIAGRIVYTTHDDSKDPEPFDIYRRTAPIDGKVTFYCRHISYRLNNVIVEPYDAGSCVAVFAGLKTHNINPNPFTYLSTVSETADFEINKPMSVRAILCGSDDMAVPQLFGGEYEWKKFYVYHRSKRGRDTSIELRYGKNLTDLTHDLDSGAVYGAVIPFWLSNDGSELAMLPEKVVVKQGATTEKVGLLDLSHEFDIYPEEEDLRDMALEALETTDLPIESLRVEFFELWNTEEYERFASLQRAYLGDTVKVIDTERGIDTDLRVVKAVYDPLLERYDSMELGTPSEDFSTVIQRQMEDDLFGKVPSMSTMEAEIARATQIITGALGGHVVIGTDANGRPNEILIMDTANKETAVNVMRINLGGIGFSTTGYDGPFRSAWTLDGHFVADFITTGHLNAALITVGLLSDAMGKNSWDMATGQLIATLATIGGINIRDGYAYGGSRASYVSNGTGFYLGSDGSMSIGDRTRYIKFGHTDPTDDTSAYELVIRLDSLLLGPSGDDVADAIAEAGQTASNYLHYDATNGLTISLTGSASGSAALPYNLQILADRIRLRNRTAIMAEFTGTGIGFRDPTNTEVAHLGSDDGLNVYQGIIGGFDADSNGFGTVYEETRLHHYDVRIKRPKSGTTKIIQSIERYYKVDPSATGEYLVGEEPLVLDEEYERCYLTRDGKLMLTELEIGDSTSNISAHIKIWNSSGTMHGQFMMGSLFSDENGTNIYNLSVLTSAVHLMLDLAVPGSPGFGGKVYVDSSSSKRYKDHVSDMPLDYARKVLEITPVLFTFKDGYLDPEDECVGKEVPGFYAEDVEEHYPMGAYHNKDGTVENWKPDRIIPALLKVIQDQEERIRNVEEKIAKLA